ncbi:hypothetical protein BDV12DRAFT_199981 [Aspergillus spectabilis]
MERYLIEKANANSGKIFKAKCNRPQLQLLTINEHHEAVGKCSLTRKQINQVEELEEAQERDHRACGRLYTVRHARSWSTLDVSRELFDRLLEIHQVFPELWKVILTFGLKSCENEYGFPTPQGRESRSDAADIQEVAYVIRRVERNNRASPDYPWSIRQTGVYQRLVQPDDMSQDPTVVLFLVAPSSSAEDNILQDLDSKISATAKAVQSAFAVHKNLVAESLVGWAEYMCWLEDQLKIRSARMCAKPILGIGKEISIKFVEDDRQHLKHLEDYITDLLVVLHTNVLNIGRLTTNCQRLCAVRCTKRDACSCRRAMHWFEDQAAEAQSYQERAKLLQAQVQSVQNLLSDLLIRELTVRSARDAIAVKLMAIITLIFLPTTLVANLFSTQLIDTEGGELHVSRQFWLILGLAVPATGVVLGVWFLWVRYECARLQPRPTEKVVFEEPHEDGEIEEDQRMGKRVTWIGALSKLPRQVSWGVSWGAPPARASSLPILESPRSFPRP